MRVDIFSKKNGKNKDKKRCLRSKYWHLLEGEKTKFLEELGHGIRSEV
jgi:hypothetical protein